MENKVRMNLIVTPKSLAKIPEHADGTLSFGSMIFVLYESGETCKVEDIANAQQTKATLQFIPVNGKEEKLLCVGNIQARIDCQILDEELAVSDAARKKIDSIFANVEVPARSFHEQMERLDRKNSGSIQQVRNSVAQVPSKVPDYMPQFQSKVLHDFYVWCPMTSAKVGYAYDTESFLATVLEHLLRSEADLEEWLYGMQSGEMYWNMLKDHLDEVQKFAHLYETEKKSGSGK